MKKIAQWPFVGYGVKLNVEEDNICYAIAHPKEGESFEDAIARAKETVYRKIKEQEENETS